MIIDTSLLVDALGGSRRSLPDLMRMIDSGRRPVLCSIVFYEWLRGPRTEPELRIQEATFPRDSVIPFEAADAELAAKLYRSLSRARTREADIAIAACAIRQNMELWTLNPADFADIPNLRLLAGEAGRA